MDLEKYTVKQLRTLANKSNISLHGLSRKADIINRLAKYYGNKEKSSAHLPQRFTINSLLKPLQSSESVPQKPQILRASSEILEPIKRENSGAQKIRKEVTSTQPFAIKNKGFSVPTERLPIISKDHTISNIDLVSKELLEDMLLNSDYPTIESLCKVNSRIYNYCQDDTFWHNKFLKDFGSNINNVSSWSLAYHNYYYLNNPSYGYLFTITVESPISIMFLVENKMEMYQQLANIYNLGLNNNPLFSFLSNLIEKNDSGEISSNKVKSLLQNVKNKTCRIEKILIF